MKQPMTIRQFKLLLKDYSDDCYMVPNQMDNIALLDSGGKLFAKVDFHEHKVIPIQFKPTTNHKG